MEKISYKGIVFYRPDYDERSINRNKTLTSIKKKLIVRKPCEICGDVNYEADAHHEKYSDYLNVRWLCKPHHRTIHLIFDKFDYLTKNIKREKELIKKYPDDCWEVHLNTDQRKLSELLKLYSVDETDEYADLL
jgi:hypothetical protein